MELITSNFPHTPLLSENKILSPNAVNPDKTTETNKIKTEYLKFG